MHRRFTPLWRRDEFKGRHSEGLDETALAATAPWGRRSGGGTSHSDPITTQPAGTTARLQSDTPSPEPSPRCRRIQHAAWEPRATQTAKSTRTTESTTIATKSKPVPAKKRVTMSKHTHAESPPRRRTAVGSDVPNGAPSAGTPAQRQPQTHLKARS